MSQFLLLHFATIFITQYGELDITVYLDWEFFFQVVHHPVHRTLHIHTQLEIFHC